MLVSVTDIIQALRPGQAFTWPRPTAYDVAQVVKLRVRHVRVELLEDGDVIVRRAGAGEPETPPQPEPEAEGLVEQEKPEPAEVPDLAPPTPSPQTFIAPAKTAKPVVDAKAASPRSNPDDVVSRWVARALEMEMDTRLRADGVGESDFKRLRFRLQYGPNEVVIAKGPFRVVMGPDAPWIIRGTAPAPVADGKPAPRERRPLGAIGRLGVNPSDVRASVDAGLPPTPLAPPGRLKPPAADPRMVAAARGGRV